MQLNEKEWSEFFIENIFSIQRGKRLTKDSQVVGYKPYVSSTAMNNGVDAFIGNTDDVRVFGNCLTIANSGSVGSSFYHPYNFVASDHVTHLKNDSLSRYSYIFTIATLNRLSEKYNFNREINDKRIKREKIILPLTENNRPNWQFMEDYTQQLMQSKKQDYIAYCQRELAKLTYKEILPLEQKEWGEFFIEDVANVKAGVRLTKADMTTGNIPFVGSSDSNNGVTAFVSNINKSEDSNILGVNYNGSVVENFYHPYTAIFSDDVKRLSLKDTKGNKFLYLFLKVCILQQKNKYQYAYKFNETRLKRQKILLPMTQDEQPDYAYMEQYMINFEYQKRSHYLSYIQQK